MIQNFLYMIRYILRIVQILTTMSLPPLNPSFIFKGQTPIFKFPKLGAFGWGIKREPHL